MLGLISCVQLASILQILVSSLEAAPPASFHIKEDSSVGSFVGDLCDVDPKKNCRLISSPKIPPSFSFGEGHFAILTAENLFRLEHKSRLLVNKRIDREGNECVRTTLPHEVCVLEQMVWWYGVGSSEPAVCTIRVNVTDINDNKPTFHVKNVTLNIREDSTAHKFKLPVASDLDVSARSSSLRYELLNADGGAINATSVFALVRNQGDPELELELVGPLDYERDREYNFQLRVEDVLENGRDTAQIPVRIQVIDVNDNRPQFANTTVNLRVRESHSLQQPLISLPATDADSGQNGKLQYSLKPTAKKNPKDISILRIDSKGNLFLKRQLDAKYGDAIFVDVVAKDNGSPSLMAECHVKIEVEDENNHKPFITFASDFTKEVEENNDENIPLTTVIVMDDDLKENGRVTCKALNGQQTDASADFRLDLVAELQADGKTVFNLMALRKFDREEESRVPLVVRCSDHGTPEPATSTVSVMVRILDMNEFPPTSTGSSWHVKEESDAGTFVGAVQVNDRDVTRNHTFHLLDYTDLFSLDSRTGRLTVRGRIDREQHEMFQLRIQVTDHGTSTFYTQVTVRVKVDDLNDHAPEFLGPTREWVMENSLHPVPIRLHARDADHGRNAQLHWELASDTESDIFLLNDSVSGTVLVNGQLLDRETKAEHNLSLIVSDKGTPSRSSHVVVLVQVGDTNDNEPVWRHPENGSFVNVSGPVEPDYPITSLKTTDLDEGENAFVTYFVVEEDVPYLFYVNTSQQPAVLHTRSTLSIGTYRVTLMAVDGTNTSNVRHSTLTTFTILVIAMKTSEKSPRLLYENPVNVVWVCVIVVFLMAVTVLVLLLVLGLRGHSTLPLCAWCCCCSSRGRNKAKIHHEPASDWRNKVAQMNLYCNPYITGHHIQHVGDTNMANKLAFTSPEPPASGSLQRSSKMPLLFSPTPSRSHDPNVTSPSMKNLYRSQPRGGSCSQSLLSQDSQTVWPQLPSPLHPTATAGIALPPYGAFLEPNNWWLEEPVYQREGTSTSAGDDMLSLESSAAGDFRRTTSESCGAVEDAWLPSTHSGSTQLVRAHLGHQHSTEMPHLNTFACQNTVQFTNKGRAISADSFPVPNYPSSSPPPSMSPSPSSSSRVLRVALNPEDIYVTCV